MKYLLSFTLMMLFSFSTFANSIEGDWYGVLDLQSLQLSIVFHLVEENGILEATMDSPDQGVNGIPVKEVSFKEKILNISMPAIGLIYTGKINSDFTFIDGTLTQRGQAFPMGLTRKAGEKKMLLRPQEPKAPFPYHEEFVTIEQKEGGFNLAGTLSLPKKEGVFPVVILISGSGPQNRDEEILGHKPFLVIADHLVKKGIAVLRYDDRGVGKSGGNFSSATSFDFSKDVEAVVEYLKTRPEIDIKNIGLIGHSEGGMIAPMVASKLSDIAFIVLLAGPGIAIEDLMPSQNKLIAKANGSSESTIQSNAQLLKKVYAQIKKEKNIEKLEKELKRIYKTELNQLPEEELKVLGDLDAFINKEVTSLVSPWFRYFIAFQPEKYLSKVTCPVLAINGEKDLQVPPAQNLAGIKKALNLSGHTDFIIKELPQLNHLFQTSTTGSPSEYAIIEETFSPLALDEISNWILLKVK